MKKILVLLVFTATFGSATAASAQSVEDENGCSGTTADPCVRSGTCSLQGTTWTQSVTIARSDLYDTMGWPGVCDQVHVALVQGNCSPGGSQVNVTASLNASSSAFVPELVGPLACNADPPPEPVPLVGPGGALALLGSLVLLGTLRTRARAQTEHAA